LKLELRDRYKVTKIGIFGSVARNEATEESDIDIVVEMEPNILKRVGLKQELEKLFNREVDVIRYRQGMNPHLKSEIDEAIRRTERCFNGIRKFYKLSLM